MKRTFRWDRLGKVFLYLIVGAALLAAFIFVPYFMAYIAGWIMRWELPDLFIARWFIGAATIAVIVLIIAICTSLFDAILHLIGWLTEPKDK